MEQDALLDIYSVTVASHEFNSDKIRRTQFLRSEDVSGNLKITVVVLGTMKPFPSSTLFVHRVERVLAGDNLRTRLATSMSVFREDPAVVQGVNDDEGQAGAESEQENGPPSGIMYAKIGAGLGAAGFLAIVAFFARGRYQRRMSNARLSDNHRNPHGLYIVEADPEIVPTTHFHNDIRHETFEERDRFSTFSYSETSSEFVHEQDYLVSLTSSSLASETLATKNSTSEYKNDTRVQLPRDDLPRLNLPLQQLRQLQTSPHDRHMIHDTEQSLDECSENSIVRTEVVQPNNGGISRLLSCFTTNSNLHGSFAQSLAGALSERTPRVSNVLGQDTIHMDRNMSTISAVSSLSGKSSCSVSVNGELYEVLVPAPKPLGLVVKSSKSGPQILHVKPTSPLYRMVDEGDYIISVDGIDARFMSARELSKWLHRNEGMTGERTIILMSCNTVQNHDEDDDHSDMV